MILGSKGLNQNQNQNEIRSAQRRTGEIIAQNH